MKTANLAVFDSAEAAAISGVDQIQQRNLRRFDFLKNTGSRYQRYTVNDLARLAVFAELTRLGVTPSRATKVADKVAPEIAKHALGEDAELFAVVQADGRVVFLAGAGKWTPGDDDAAGIGLLLSSMGATIARRAKRPLVEAVQPKPAKKPPKAKR